MGNQKKILLMRGGGCWEVIISENSTAVGITLHSILFTLVFGQAWAKSEHPDQTWPLIIVYLPLIWQPLDTLAGSKMDVQFFWHNKYL